MVGGEYILTREEAGFVAEQKAVYSRLPPKLLDRLREALRSRHYSRRTEQTLLPLGETILMKHPMKYRTPKMILITYKKGR
jgi:hypothetical protein